MKKLTLLSFSIIFSSIICLILGSCSQKTDRSSVSEPMFTSEDTTIVITKCEDWLNKVKEKDFDAAFASLDNLKNGDLSKLTLEEKEALKNQFTSFPVLSYKLVNMTWRNTYDVKLAYSFEFMEVEEGSGIPNTMTVTFAPERRNKIWYLAIEK